MSKFILYDYMQVSGGAERLTLDMAEAFPKFQTVVSRIYPESHPLLESRAGLYRGLESLGNRYTSVLPRVIEAFLMFNCKSSFLNQADKVIYSGVFAPFAVFNQLSGKKYYYCHTPPRFAYDRRTYYLSRCPAITRPLMNVFLDRFCYDYERALGEMDKIFVNSKNVQNRLIEISNIKSSVISPPIDTKSFKWLSEGDYYLSLARLEPKKRVDLIIKAFLQMPDKRLVIASSGSQYKKLINLAQGANNIAFTGWQSDQQLKKLIGCSRAIIYIPENEDFGMSPVEGMASGKPVISVADGGMLETILDGKTGMLLPKNICCDDIKYAVGQMTHDRTMSMRAHCEARAHIFSRENFIRELSKQIDESAARL